MTDSVTMAQWLTGNTRSGKTTWLVQKIADWADPLETAFIQGKTFLCFAANGDNRIQLAERITQQFQGRYPVFTTTPTGFIQDEITLFWPLLVHNLGLDAQFPLKLRPENEQELAAQFWQPQLLNEEILIQGWLPDQTVRRILDFLQLAASAGIPVEDLPTLLREGIPPGFATAEVWERVGAAIAAWRDWCLERGVITYGIMTELYWRHLLPDPTYREKLAQRYCAVLADDLDEYPGVARQWFEVCLGLAMPSAFTWNNHGKVRLGVGADPDALIALQAKCDTIVTLPLPAEDSLAAAWADPIVAGVQDPLGIPFVPEPIQTLQTTSRGEILRRTAEFVAEAIDREAVAPREVAIIAPGLDAIARYTLAEILMNRGVPVESLNDQRPLISSPLIRALLTLITLVYPGLGRLVDHDTMAEMLVVLSQVPHPASTAWYDEARIDPVRAELIADHCFVPDIEHPTLLPVDRFPRWDRLGHRAAAAYERILQWIAQQQAQRQQRLIPGVVGFLDRAIQHFLGGGSHLPYDQLAALRELMETAQHYWEVENRLQRFERMQGRRQSLASSEAIARFIQLLRRGTVTANPFPVRSLDPANQGVTIATVFQYRLQHLCHPWHFWLDAGSPRWLTGTDALFGFPLFLQGRVGRPWTSQYLENLHAERLERILRDLLGRVTERVFLCHSDLAVSGQEQTGPLLTLVNTAESAAIAPPVTVLNA